MVCEYYRLNGVTPCGLLDYYLRSKTFYNGLEEMKVAATLT